MKTLKRFSLPLLAAALVGSPAYAQFQGLEMRMGSWDVKFSGNVNGFVTSVDCDSRDDALVAHGLACGSNGDDYDAHSIRTGLLPAWFNLSASTVTPGGIKTGAHVSFQPGIDTHSGVGGHLDGPLGGNSANFRQVFLTWGNESMGTFKIGRDLGVFGSDAILQDMTLLGVGTVSDLTVNGGRTSLGRIGVGYIYADWKSQFQYTSPNMNGFTVTAALVDTWGAGSIAGGSHSTTAANAGQEGDSYGFEAKVNYAGEMMGGGINLWLSYIRQEVDFNNAPSIAGRPGPVCADIPGRPCDVAFPAVPAVPAAADFDDSGTADGFDIGAKVTVGSADVVAYYYDGDGIGTTGFMIDGFDWAGNDRDSDGWYIQGRYRMPTGTLLGVSYGESNLDETSYDKRNGASSLVETNDSWVIGVYHPVGEALNLVAEYTRTDAEAHNGNEAEEEVFALGAIIFY